MKKKFILSFFFLFILYVQAQQITISLKDSLTNKPVSFATILLVQDDKHFYADYCNEEGVIIIEENRSFDAVTFSCVGYKDKTIGKGNLKDSIVYLTPESYQLDEVVITNKKVIDTLLLGKFNESKKGTLPLYVQNEVALFFENNFDEEVALKTFLFKMWKVKYKTAIRLRLYEKRIFKSYHFLPDDPKKLCYYFDTSIPGDDLLGDNIILYIEPQKRKVVEVDLSQYNIPMPKEGVFVSMECLGYFDEGNNSITLNENKLSEIEMHTTMEDNYCIKYTNINRFWVNQNKRLKIDYEYALKTEIPKNVLKEPTFGLKVVRLE